MAQEQTPETKIAWELELFSRAKQMGKELQNLKNMIYSQNDRGRITTKARVTVRLS